MSNYDLEKLDMLPHWENRAQNLTRREGKHFYPRRYYRNSLYNPWKIRDRILDNNIGKSFDAAFSYFCQKVRVQDQHYFLDEFSPRHRYYHPQWKVDDDGNIQRAKDPHAYKGPYRIYTKDAEFGYRRIKERGYKKSYSKVISEKDHKDYWWSKDKYEKVLTKGEELVFESKNNPVFQRITAEKLQSEKKSRKQNPKGNKTTISEETFRRILREREQEERRKDRMTMIKHGFDPELSFRNHK